MLIVVGGHTRNIGKTSAVAAIIHRFADKQWTAIKITQYGHNVCSANGEPCDCQTADHTIALSEERDAQQASDTGRFLAAGAARSLWLRTRQGQLVEAMPRLRTELAKSANNILESNSVLRFLRPDLYLAVLSPAVEDFKDSARYFLDRADAYLITEPLGNHSWHNVSATQVNARPHFVFKPGMTVEGELEAFLRSRIYSSGSP